MGKERKGTAGYQRSSRMISDETLLDTLARALLLKIHFEHLDFSTT